MINFRHVLHCCFICFPSSCFLFQNNSISECEKKKPLVLIALITLISTIKTTRKPKEPGDEVECSANSDSISLQQMVATPTQIYISYYWQVRRENVKGN